MLPFTSSVLAALSAHIAAWAVPSGSTLKAVAGPDATYAVVGGDRYGGQRAAAARAK